MNMNVYKCKQYDNEFRIESKITVGVEGRYL